MLLFWDLLFLIYFNNLVSKTAKIAFCLPSTLSSFHSSASLCLPVNFPHPQTNAQPKNAQTLALSRGWWLSPLCVGLFQEPGMQITPSWIFRNDLNLEERNRGTRGKRGAERETERMQSRETKWFCLKHNCSTEGVTRTNWCSLTVGVK